MIVYTIWNILQTTTIETVFLNALDGRFENFHFATEFLNFPETKSLLWLQNKMEPHE